MEKFSFSQLKEAELTYLAKEKKKKPELFRQEIFLDTPEILKSVGIFGAFPKNLPLGYLRLWPQDFIVEEISGDNKLQTIETGSFLKKSSQFSKEDPTIFATLVKCGLSTLEVQEELSKNLGLEKKAISFAGIKDKNTISSQLISLRKGDIEKLKQLQHPNFFFKDVYSGKGIVETGNLKGNLFTIFIRTDKSFSKEKFLDQLVKIKKEGFWNFFYLQRFGTPKLISHLLGLFILRGEYEKVVYNFLTYPGKRELLYFQELRKKIKENWRDWEKIEALIKPFPIIFRHEKKLVNHLKESPRGFLEALKTIPDQIQLWVFAYASYLFNRKLSSLIREKREVPETLPLILSKNRKDWQPYFEFLRADNIHFSFKPLRPFPFLQYMRRQIKTKAKIELKKIKILPEGVILSFFLPKASYATTFLAHSFTLASGLPPQGISLDSIDTKAALTTGNLRDVLNRFQAVISPKSEDILEKFG